MNYQTTETYAYNLGFNAATIGKTYTSNPYITGTACHHAFHHGYQDGTQKLKIERIKHKQAQISPTLDTCTLRA